MAFCELKYFSPALGKATAANILLPEGKGDGPFPTFYLLHGLSDDHTMWHRRTSIERYVQGLPLIVVMPDSGRGFYCDARQGAKWASAITQDLVGYVDRMFHTRPEREARCVAGLSMGGYGAVKFALAHPELLCAAVSHSGAMGFAHRPLPPDPNNPFNAEFARVVGENPAGGPDDLYALAEKLPIPDRPALRIDCGTEDFLLEDNRAFHAHLDQIGFAHEYAEYPGAHNWAYWNYHILNTLQFMGKAIGFEFNPKDHLYPSEPVK